MRPRDPVWRYTSRQKQPSAAPALMTARARPFRQSMAWLHIWAGLLPGWVLFVIFLFGTTAFFQHEITQWMRPEIHGAAVSARAMDRAGDYLRTRGAGADSWSITSRAERGGDISVTWQMPEAAGTPGGKATLDPTSGREIRVRDTLGGWFLYRFHFDLYYMPWWVARYIVSIAAMAMLVAILSGIVTHKKIFADFFLLRFGKGQRSWLDAHNVTAALALPFHLMITYTGLVTLLFTLMPWAISANFADEDAVAAALYPSYQRAVAGVAAPVLPISQLIASARTIRPGASFGYIEIEHPGDAGAVATLYTERERLGGELGTIRLDAVTGAVLQRPVPIGGANATQSVMIDLHTGVYAGLMLRWLYFLSGVGGTVMVATGLTLWTVKRGRKLPDPAHPPFGFRLVQRLNVGFIAGAPAGIAVYFLANRMLPIDMAARADWEIHSLFIGWGAIFTWGLLRPIRRAWIETLAAGAALYALVPPVSAITTDRGLVSSLLAGDRLFVTFDLMMIVVAATLGFASRKVAGHRQQAPRSRRKRSVETRAPVETSEAATAS
jgi:uncharacterized iron-regulated membrane protein